jgi:hypothetical protein
VNSKLIPSILPNYIPPLVGAVICDSVPRDFEYTLIIVYLPKGIHAVGPQLGQITMLNINDFNLGDHKNHGILIPHKYLTRTKGKKSKIIPHPWTMDIARSTILNMMKIPHFGRHHEVNMCIKILLSFFHGGYLWLDRHITVDSTLIHQITGLVMQGPNPDLIGSLVVTREEYDVTNSSRRKKKEEVKDPNITSEETASDSPGGGGDDEVDKEEDKGEEDKKKQGEVTPPRDPIDEAETSKKRKVSPMKPTSWNKSKATKPQMKTMITMDGIDFIIVAISDTSEDILQYNEDKQDTMYEIIEEELKGVQQALYSICTVSTTPPSS